MTYLTLLLQITIGLAFAALAIALLVQSPKARLLLDPAPQRRLARVTVSTLAALPTIGMLLAALVPFLAFFSAMISTAVVAGFAIASRLRGGRSSVLLSVGLIIASLGVAVLQPLGLRVLSLPKAAELPYEPVRASVIKTYGEGVWFESVRADSNGNLYLTANRGLDFTVPDYYREATGQIIVRNANGRERVLFSTPKGHTAGVMAIAPDGWIYMTSNGAQPAIWRIAPDGRSQKLASLPDGAWPNGIDFGPDGMLYAADSNLTQVWRVDPATGMFSVALRDQRLAARPFVALAPGANGLHFAGREMIVTVSDSTEILRYKLNDDGSFSQAVRLADGIPGDDFAVGPDGSLFVTTHPYNTIVRIAPGGLRTIIADARQHVTGATDVTFGTTPADRDTLYVATDGGAFTGGAQTRGQLVALKPYS